MLDRSEYDKFRVSPLDPATLRARDVERSLKKLAEASTGRLTFERFAESVEGRPIYLAKIGTGPRRVLLWSQMHGDEPTHTAVLLDLASYLLQSPAQPHANDILKGCTLHFIPMLNPDGAEAVMRFNAQGIDINRDARRLATPEGRALRHAVEKIKPEYGFNLHNQNARTTVGKPPKPAAVSVLAPAPDTTGHETASWRRAKQMCAVFIEAVRPIVPGMISRYDDAHEPRAFGDTIQATGASTMLVEAGGWSDAVVEPLTRVHFHGMLTTLHAIATDQCGAVDLKIYEELPESNSSRQMDCMISNGLVMTSAMPKSFKADLGIDQSSSERLGGRSKHDGRIIEIGDLGVLSAKTHIDGSQWLILPGRIAFLEDWSPDANLSGHRIHSLLSQGVTTVIGCVQLEKDDGSKSIGADRELPFNWGFVGRIDKAGRLSADELAGRAAAAANQGLLAIATNQADEEIWQQLDRLGLTLVQLAHLSDAATSKSYGELVAASAKIYKLLNLHGKRGRVGRDAFADLAFFSADEGADKNTAADMKRPVRVMVAGETVWENGRRVGGSPGVFLRRT